MLVSDILRKKDSTIYKTTPDTPVLDAIAHLNEHNIGSLLVLDGDDLAGIITERDIMRAIGRNDTDLDQFTVGDLMTKSLIVCEPGEKLDKIMVLMTEKRIRHLPVLDGGVLQGIISIGDVVKARLQEIELEAQELKDYIRGVR